jgi:hypothetical protein
MFCMAVKRTRQQKFRSLRAANGPRLKSNPGVFRTLVNGERKTFRKAARSNHPLFDFVELQSEEERPQKNDQLGSKVRVRATLEPNHGYASPKFCPALKSTACTLSSAGVSAMTGAHVSLRRIRVGPAHPLLSIASKPAPGKSRSPATVGCAEAQASPTPDGSG